MTVFLFAVLAVECILFVLLGHRLFKTFLNPLSIFDSVWFGMVALYQLRLSKLQQPLSVETMALILLLTTVFSTVFVGLAALVLRRSRTEKPKIVSFRSVLYLFLAWAAIEIFEVIVSGGVPLYWKLRGIPKTYFDFGVPTLHGLMNAFSLAICALSSYLLAAGHKIADFKHSQRKWLTLTILAILGFNLIVISRQQIISAILEIAFIAYFVRQPKVTFNRLFMIIAAIILGIIAFGIVGDLRTGNAVFLQLAQIDTNVPNFLVGFYWVYIYIVMSLANINNAVLLGINHYGFSSIITTLLPSMIRNKLHFPAVPSILVNPNFNVSSFLSGYYVGLGWAGVVLGALVYALVGGLIFAKFRKSRTEKNIILAAIYMQIITLSFFIDFMTYLPNVFQFVIIFIVFKTMGREECRA